MAGCALVLLWIGFVGLCAIAQELPLYFYMNEPVVSQCDVAGATGNIELDKKNIYLMDIDTSNKVNYIKLPGNYQVVMMNVQVKNSDIPYVVFDLHADVRAKSLAAGYFFDRTVIPHSRDGQWQCGNYSSPSVEASGRQYCRYCNICQQLASVGRKLRKQKLIPEWSLPGDHPQCSALRKGQTYNFKQPISLPFFSQVKGGVAGLKEEIRNGVLTLELRIYERHRLANLEEYCEKPCKGDNWAPECQSCQKDYGGLRFGAGGPDQKQCMVQGNRVLSGCYTVKFRFSSSNNFIDVVSGVTQQGQQGANSTDPCDADIKAGKEWCRGCWFCGPDDCSRECACYNRSECG